jgi:3-deoxy-manno-octulosonate cytidylyltransferase (CMP-KDO synthetase)
MKFIALIPARYLASRFPAKLLQLLDGKPVIVHTYLNTLATNLFEEVIVVTDHPLIEEAILSVGGKVQISQKTHESGTDRIAEIAESINADVFINVQGDEPFVNSSALQALCALFEDSETQVGSLMVRISKDEASNPNAVKVVTNKKGEALYFSRSIIPYEREISKDLYYYKHIGVYAYRKACLLKISRLQPTRLEQTEKLEQLRMLENNISIRMAEVDSWSVAIDTPQDLEQAKIWLEKNNED